MFSSYILFFGFFIISLFLHLLRKSFLAFFVRASVCLIIIIVCLLLLYFCYSAHVRRM